MLGNLINQFFGQKKPVMMGNDLPEQGGIMGFYPQPQGNSVGVPPPVARQVAPAAEQATSDVPPSGMFPQKRIQDVGSSTLSPTGTPPDTTDIEAINRNLGIGYPQRTQIATGEGSLQDANNNPNLPMAPMVSAPAAPMTKAESRTAEKAAWNALTPEEKQKRLIAGQGPVEHSALKRTLLGLAQGGLAGLASGNGIAGALGGAATGAIGQGFFPSINQKVNARQMLPQVNAQVAYDKQQADEAAKQKMEDQKFRIGETNISNINEDNARQRDELKRKGERDVALEKRWNRAADTADFRAMTAADLVDMRDKWATSKDVNDKRRLDLVEKEMANRNERASMADNTKRTITDVNNTVRSQLQAERLKHGDEAFKQRAADSFKQAYVKRNDKNPSQAEVDNYLNNIVPPEEQ